MAPQLTDAPSESMDAPFGLTRIYNNKGEGSFDSAQEPF